MKEKNIIKNALEFVTEYFKNDASGHDAEHTFRVWRNAQKIAKKEKCNNFIIELASLLHDVDDDKINKTDTKYALEFMKKEGLDKETIDSIMYILDNQSYSDSIGKGPLKTIEARIVQDADRLDAIGAIAIARVFQYGGRKGRTMFDPNVKAKEYTTTEEYRNSNTSSINHIYDKLIKLKALLNTKTAKKIAQSRHKYMLNYLKQFEDEWYGRR